MVEFKTEKSFIINFGNNKFIEVAIKEVDGNRFVSLAKGFLNPQGERRFKKALGFPLEKELIEKVIEALQQLS